MPHHDVLISFLNQMRLRSCESKNSIMKIFIFSIFLIKEKFRKVRPANFVPVPAMTPCSHDEIKEISRQILPSRGSLLLG